MGSEAIWVPLAMAAVGAGTNYYNTTQTNKRTDRELAAQIAAQGGRQREAAGLVQDAIQRQEGSNPDAARRSALEQYMEVVLRNRGQAAGGLGQVGAVSDRYGEAANDAATDIASYGANRADMMSRIDAPIRQRQEEGIQFGRLGSELDRVAGMSASDAYLGDLRLRSVRRNPWLDAAAEAANAYGSSYSPSTAKAPARSGQGSLLTFGNNLDNFRNWGS